MYHQEHFLRGIKRRFNYSIDSPRLRAQQKHLSEVDEELVSSPPLYEKENDPIPIPQPKKKEEGEDDVFIKFKIKIRKSDVKTAAIAVAAGLAVLLLAKVLMKEPGFQMPRISGGNGIIIDGVQYFPLSEKVFSGLVPL